MPAITIDFETFYSSDYSLKKMSEVDYILDPRFQAIMCAIKVGSAPSETVVGHTAIAARFATIDWERTFLLAHNMRFDGAIALWHFGVRPKMYGCTLSMARAMTHAVLGRSSLEKVSEYLGLPPKGKEIVMALGKRLEDFSEYELTSYEDYCKRDNENCRAMFDIFRARMPDSELRLIDTIMRMFVEPQVFLDPHALSTHLHDVQARKQAIMDRVGHIDKSVFSSSQKFADLLVSLGVEVPTKTSPATGEQIFALAKNDRAFKELCQDDTKSLEVQAMLAARINAKSTLEETRTASLLNLSLRKWKDGATGWAPVPIKYYGAHTGRMSGDGGFNWLNFARGSKIRDAIVAPDGFRVVHRDSSQIEARMVAWLADCHYLMNAFAQSRDVYSEFASDIYKRHVTKADTGDRFVGKTCLAAGTRVLTDAGVIPIEYVTTSHILWDGIEWVHHDGLMAYGLKETLTVSGISLTPDHLVWCGTEWREARYVARRRNTQSLRSALAAASLPSRRGSDTGNTPTPCQTTHNGPASGSLKPVYDLTNAGPRHRFTVITDDGPLIVANSILGLGYGMGPLRFRHTLFIGNGGISLSIDEEEATRIVYLYRRKYFEIPALWKRAEMAFSKMITISQPVRGPSGRKAREAQDAYDERPLKGVVVGHEALWMPNGMCIAFPDVREDTVRGADGKPRREVSYADPYRARRHLFGGKEVENISQALARIIITDIIDRVALETGYHPFLSTYDSVDYCIPERDAEAFDVRLTAEFERRPVWAPELPLASEGGWGVTMLQAEHRKNV